MPDDYGISPNENIEPEVTRVFLQLEDGTIKYLDDELSEPDWRIISPEQAIELLTKKS